MSAVYRFYPKSIRLRTVIITAVCIVVAIGVIFQGIFMLMVVPSASMEPTIDTGYLLIGVRNPKELTRGDILAFQTDSAVLIKRLIGLPDEVVCILEDGSVTVNGELLSEPYVLHQRYGRKQQFHVPDGFLLFLGDNRANSFDARYWDNPYISYEAVMARADYVLFPRASNLQNEGMKQ
jgi:signal peptidase I